MTNGTGTCRTSSTPVVPWSTARPWSCPMGAATSRSGLPLSTCPVYSTACAHGDQNHEESSATQELRRSQRFRDDVPSGQDEAKRGTHNGGQGSGGRGLETGIGPAQHPTLARAGVRSQGRPTPDPDGQVT